ncbi:tyrosine-type recombinase/integrase [Gemmiger formicilis]|uniref:tyrosine-type recombinase/integrase n=1 Tax=Gemmiger formicilis TaxID=745368 RepID=UPI003AB532EF
MRRILKRARHTFGTTVTLANNVPLQDVSVMLGHASTRMTQHYARRTAQKFAAL